MHAFWLVLTCDLLEDRRIDDVIVKTFFNSLLYKTNRFQVAVRLFSNRSQRMSKCGKNISDTLSCASCATFLFLPHFDVICDLLLNRRTTTWNLFVKYIDIALWHYKALLSLLCIFTSLSSPSPLVWLGWYHNCGIIRVNLMLPPPSSNRSHKTLGEDARDI